MITETITKSRSIRNFLSGKTVPKDILTDLVNITRFCPSGANLQPLKYRIVEEKSECDSIYNNIRFAGYLPPKTVPKPNHEPTAYIVICRDNNISNNKESSLIDTGIVAQTILLYAAEQGISGCMIGSFNIEPIKNTLKLPQNIEINLILALGYPDEKVEIVDCINGNIKYYRENDIHYVPKRLLDDILL